MAERDGAASIQGDAIRITPLTLEGTIDTNKPVLTTNGFISASFGTEFEDGDEISEKAADGTICIQYKASDSMKGITFNLSLCSPDPEASALIAGGQIICAKEDVKDPATGLVVQPAGTVIGYTSPAVGDTVGNPIAVEIWSKAIVKGKPAAGTPYYHWVFPYVRVRYEGDREFTNGALANEFSGTGVGNDALVTNGLLPINAFDDFVTYRAALTNPFSYVRTTSKPSNGWLSDWTYTPDNSLYCAPIATGATAGAPGEFTPTGAMAPSNLQDLQAGIPAAVIANPTAHWAKDTWVILADKTEAHWNGTSWAAGRSLGLFTAAVTLGLTGQNSAGNPAAEVGGGADGGVRVIPAREGVEIPVDTLTGVDWGDGDTTFDTTGGYIAHIYNTVATGIVIKLTHSGEQASATPTFDVVPGNATGATEVAGVAGTWTPAGSKAAADLAGMAAVTATPQSAWAAGSHMVLGDASLATWGGDTGSGGTGTWAAV